jgi:arylsulfatase
LNEAASPNVKNKSHSITADVIIPEGGGDGAIAVQGGRFGGWSLYMKEGRLKYCYNFIALEESTVESAEPVAAGEHQVRIEFNYDGGGVGMGADLTLYVDGEAVGSGRTEHSIPYLTSLDETLDIGVDDASPVTEDYSTKNGRFSGKINWVQIDLGLDDHSHMIDVEQMISVRMAKQ